ncbi:MAG: efflux RND transporter periplasmic adaptor subunit, partial [Acidobacteria bacterium]|nr:efflux RND transporter periplasmic adaptor subunit [Acidobacteriota bacterium]
EVRPESVPTVVEVPGTVQPRERIPLASQIQGYVRAVHVRVGDAVSRGRLLASLDARDAQSQKTAALSSIREAEGALSEARRTHQAALELKAASEASNDLATQTLARYEKLFSSRSVSPQEIDEVRMRQKAARAELAAREAQAAAALDRIGQVEARIAQVTAQSGRTDVLLGWSEIQAPAAGRIVEVSVDPGAALFPGTPLMVIESTDRAQVVAHLPSAHADALGAGMKVRVRGGAGEDAIEGRVSEIVPVSDPGTHTVEFKVDLPAGASAPSGRFMKVEVPVGTRTVLLAPKEAVRTTGQLTGLFVIAADSRAFFRLVKLAPYDEARVEILSGVQPGETIVARLDGAVTDGMRVESGR